MQGLTPSSLRIGDPHPDSVIEYVQANVVGLTVLSVGAPGRVRCLAAAAARTRRELMRVSLARPVIRGEADDWRALDLRGKRLHRRAHSAICGGAQAAREVAGLSAERVRAVADRYGYEHRVFGLDDPEALVTGLAGVGVVLHCAGPFSRTSKPMIDACLAAQAHHLDITGEIAVFESAAARDADARSAGVMLLPGTGFDVVPSDCLALHIARKLPDAHELTLGFFRLGSVSHGTATTMVENVHPRDPS